jgi:hypothetical protein
MRMMMMVPEDGLIDILVFHCWSLSSTPSYYTTPAEKATGSPTPFYHRLPITTIYPQLSTPQYNKKIRQTKARHRNQTGWYYNSMWQLPVLSPRAARAPPNMLITMRLDRQRRYKMVWVVPTAGSRWYAMLNDITNDKTTNGKNKKYTQGPVKATFI